MMNVLDARCRRRTKGDPRTLDQRRADTLTTLILTPGVGDAPSASQTPDTPTMVSVIIPIETLMGVCDTPGEIDGYGPISAREARTLAAGRKTVWRRLFVLSSGKVAHIDPRRRFP